MATSSMKTQELKHKYPTYEVHKSLKKLSGVLNLRHLPRNEMKLNITFGWFGPVMRV